MEYPLIVVLQMDLKVVPTEHINAENKKICSGHKNDANLIGCSLLDNKWTGIFGTEMLHVYEMKDTIFGAKSRDTSDRNVFT